MKTGRIEGPLIGQSHEIQEWVVTTRSFSCGKCGKKIPAQALAYRQTILEGKRFDRSYTYCESCAKESGKQLPRGAIARRERTGKAKKEKERQRLLFPES